MLSINKKTNVDRISSIYKNDCKIFYNMFVITIPNKQKLIIIPYISKLLIICSSDAGHDTEEDETIIIIIITIKGRSYNRYNGGKICVPNTISYCIIYIIFYCDDKK